LRLTTGRAIGVIITVSILLAAGIAVYENPNVREWIDRSRHRIAMALHSLGDDLDPRSRSPRVDDPSMREDESEVAEARRRQARAEILERGRIMEERRRRKHAGKSASDSSQTFDRAVDKDGMLRQDPTVQATSSAVEPASASEGLTNRHNEPQGQDLHESVDSGISLRQLSPAPVAAASDADPFTSKYEQEMRNAWNLPMLETDRVALSSHASESLIDFTPTSEFPPDPEVSVPDTREGNQRVNDSQYFSAAASTTSNTLSNDEPEFYYAHPSNPNQPIGSAPQQSTRSEIPVSVSSAPSIAGSMDHVHASDVEASEDGVMSELGDGIHTPGSAWTDVGSVVSDAE
jgi:hypothetical protein